MCGLPHAAGFPYDYPIHPIYIVPVEVKGVLPIIYIHYIGRRLVLCPAPVTCARASVGIGPWLFITEKNFFLAVPVGLIVEDAVVCCRGCRPQPMAYSYWRMRAAPRLLKVASAPSKVGSVEINRFLS